jgi:hypothetical protein
MPFVGVGGSVVVLADVNNIFIVIGAKTVKGWRTKSAFFLVIRMRIILVFSAVFHLVEEFSLWMNSRVRRTAALLTLIRMLMALGRTTLLSRIKLMSTVNDRDNGGDAGRIVSVMML